MTPCVPPSPLPHRSPVPSRVLICGSLYLAGHVLSENG